MATQIQINDPATIVFVTDRHPATIVNIKKNSAGVVTKLFVQRDEYKIVSGSAQDGSAEYEYSPNTSAPIHIFTLRKNGDFCEEGQAMKYATRCWPGVRRRYYDPHF